MISKKCEDEPIWIWGVPLWPYTLQETMQAVAVLIAKQEPAFFITANVHYSMLTEENPDLREVNGAAGFIVADGAPLVWASRLTSRSLPERVAGSDLIFDLSRLASQEKYRLFLAGGAPGVAEEAASRLVARYPGLMVVGTASPSFRDVSGDDYANLKAQIHDTRPDILIIAATMPFGERWLAAHVEDLGVPISVNLGAALDFAAGRITRAPRWMQRVGLEWAFRLMLEPRRLFSRYSRNALFIARMLIHGADATRSASSTQIRPRRDADLNS